MSKDVAHVSDQDARELALQVIDIVTLRPEIELCYLAIAGKCFEVLEARPVTREHRMDSDDSSVYDSSSGEGEGEVDNQNDEDDDEGDADADDADISAVDPVDEGEETETETEDDVASDYEDDELDARQKSQMRLRLREILFYDDKIAIFKARHGRL